MSVFTEQGKMLVLIATGRVNNITFHLAPTLRFCDQTWKLMEPSIYHYPLNIIKLDIVWQWLMLLPELLNLGQSNSLLQLHYKTLFQRLKIWIKYTYYNVIILWHWFHWTIIGNISDRKQVKVFFGVLSFFLTSLLPSNIFSRDLHRTITPCI